MRYKLTPRASLKGAKTSRGYASAKVFWDAGIGGLRADGDRHWPQVLRRPVSAAGESRRYTIKGRLSVRSGGPQAEPRRCRVWWPRVAIPFSRSARPKVEADQHPAGRSPRRTCGARRRRGSCVAWASDGASSKGTSTPRSEPRQSRISGPRSCACWTGSRMKTVRSMADHVLAALAPAHELVRQPRSDDFRSPYPRHGPDEAQRASA